MHILLLLLLLLSLLLPLLLLLLPLLLLTPAVGTVDADIKPPPHPVRGALSHGYHGNCAY